MKYTDLNNLVSDDVNISERERLISGISGGLLLAMGVFDFSKSSFRRALRMTAGTLLILRGVTGYCPAKARFCKTETASAEEKLSTFADA